VTWELNLSEGSGKHFLCFLDTKDQSFGRPWIGLHPLERLWTGNDSYGHVAIRELMLGALTCPPEQYEKWRQNKL
jgi:hypothetical protein